MSDQTQNSYSVDKSTSKFESILGFDFNFPYLSPKQVQNKIQIDNEDILRELGKHIHAIRKLNCKNLQLTNSNGEPFWFYSIPKMEEHLYMLDKEGAIYSYTFQGLDLEQNFFNEFLFSESFFSLKTEGYTIPYRRAIEILTEGISPEDDIEQLLLNYRDILNNIFNVEKITVLNLELFEQIYKSLFHDTSFFEEGTSILRNNNEIAFVDVLNGNHSFSPIPPNAMTPLLNNLLDWLYNQRAFFHPILKGSILYFYLLYLQPFKMGNGIMARLLFYQFLQSSGYGIMKYLSISEIIDHERGKYTSAFEDSITNKEDISYFLFYIIESLYSAFSQFRKSSDNEAKWLKNQQKINQMHIPINERQLKVMKGFSLDKYTTLTTEKVEKMCQVGSDTARKDLNDLVKWKLLVKKKDGKSFLYESDEF